MSSLSTSPTPLLGSGIADAWPTAAYEQIADLAGRTPIVVQTEHVGPMEASRNATFGNRTSSCRPQRPPCWRV